MDEALNDEISRLSSGLLSCSRILTAFGNETRQHLILEMMKMKDCNGVRVGKITEKTYLSRPAVSHHLRILRDAGIIKMRREGTKNYYYFDPDMKELKQLIEIFQLAAKIAESLPEREQQEEVS